MNIILIFSQGFKWIMLVKCKGIKNKIRRALKLENMELKMWT